MIDQRTIRQVHDKADIVDIVKKYGVQLISRGANLMGCCPFHNERNPSFIVSPKRNTYHCFSCGAHGNPVSFVMNHAHKTYPEAIEEIAKTIGINVIRTDRERTQEDISQEKEREEIRIAMAYVQQFFTARLQDNTPEASKAREYAYSRWGEEYCKEVGIGYAPDSWNALQEYCREKGLNEDALVKASVLAISEKTQKPYPFFRSRITIPITDRFGNVIAFTARYIGEDPSQHKYINSKDTPVFKKGDTVFGLHTAIRQASRNGRFIIVEGAPDALMLQSDGVGLAETVAALGTSWTEEQFKQLKRHATALVFLPDADVPKDGEQYGPGIKAVMRNGITALRMGFDVSVREIPFAEIKEEAPYSESEIEQLKEKALADKIKKSGITSKKKLAEISLTDSEIAELPKMKTIATRYSKNDPDSYITSIDAFNGLEDEMFPVWYAKKKLSGCVTDIDKLTAVKEISSDVLTAIEDESMLNLCIERISRIYGKEKMWRDSLQKAKGERRKQADEKAMASMSRDKKILHELGIVVKDGAYWSDDKTGKLTQWTNFTMTPLYHIIDGDTSIRTFKIRNDEGKETEIELLEDELTALKPLNEHLGKKGNFVFFGDYMTLMKLKRYLYAIPVSAIMLSKMGWNTEEEIYVFGDGIFAEGAFHPVDEVGIVKLGEKNYYLPAFSKANIRKRDSYTFEKKFAYRNHGTVSLYEYVRSMVDVFGDNAKVGFAFLLATLFQDVVKESAENLALLNIFGEKGSGKTQLGTALMAFFIRKNTPPSLASLTVPSLNDMISQAENNLVHIDEYKNEVNFRQIEMLKSIWGGTGQTKKNMDGDKKAKQTKVYSGIILTGQDAPTRDDALFSRTIHLAYSKTVFSKEENSKYAEFKAISDKGAAHLTLELLKLRDVFEKGYEDSYAICKRDIMEALENDTIETRILNNWLAPLAALHTVQDSIDIPFGYKNLFNVCVEGIRVQNKKITKNSDVSVFFSLVDSAHMKGKIINNAHFVIRRRQTIKLIGQREVDFGSPKTLLFLNFKSIADTIGQRMNGMNTIGRLDQTSLESYLKSHPAYLGTQQMRFQILLPNGLPDYTVESIGDQRFKKIKEVKPSAMVFDYDMLKDKYELNLEITERMENELTEDDIEEQTGPFALKNQEDPGDYNLFGDE